MDVDAQPDAPAGGEAPAPAMAIDPFGFVPGHISRIGGLGGDMPGPFESYAFHTPYVPLSEGHMVFVINFAGLAATRGTLDLVVHAMSPRYGAQAQAIERTQLPLRLLAAEDDGRATIPFEALDGLTYSLFGQIFDETDAAAQSLSIDIWRRSELRADLELQLAGKKTEFVAEDVKPVARLISGDPPSLEHPVSQIATVKQLAEPVCSEWLAALGLGDADRAAWGQAYIMQALRRYGMLAPRARGLGLAVGGGPLPAAMAASGCTVIATGPDEDGGGLAALRRPGLCDDAAFDASVTFRPTDPASVPDLADFDFLWSLDLDARLPSAADAARLAEQAMDCLKPGGLAVHVFGYAPDGVSAGGTLRRNDLERLSLSLISRGHEIAQFKYEARDPLVERGIGAFGIIARRGMRI